MIALRRMVSTAERTEYSRKICQSLRTQLLGLKSLSYIAVYLATKDEIPLDEFISSAPSSIHLASPRWNPSTRTYELASLPDPYSSFTSSLSMGHWGIREPSPDAPTVNPRDIDAWIVPGLAFTESGKRLGYGGGYYDRLLASASPNAISIAIAYPFQILPDLPSSPHDIPISKVLTIA